MVNNYKYFTNKHCEYYPCHKGIEGQNCLFCFCPLYHFCELRIKQGIQCEDCIIPHIPGNYDLVINELVKNHDKEMQNQRLQEENRS